MKNSRPLKKMGGGGSGGTLCFEVLVYYLSQQRLNNHVLYVILRVQLVMKSQMGFLFRNSIPTFTSLNICMSVVPNNHIIIILEMCICCTSAEICSNFHQHWHAIASSSFMHRRQVPHIGA